MNPPDPSEAKTPTPRTDALMKEHETYNRFEDEAIKRGSFLDDKPPQDLHSFARQLERENQSLRKSAEAARVALEVALETIAMLSDDIPLLGAVVEQGVQETNDEIIEALAALRAELEGKR